MPELLDTLANYVPALITRRLAEDPALPTAPVGNRFPTATLFADITGFTRLAERLARRGPSGAEELTRLLNDYFWRASLAAAEHVAMRYETGRAHYEIGRHLPAGDPNRKLHLTRACEIFSELGAGYDLSLVSSQEG